MIGGEDDTDLRAYSGLFWRHPVQAATLSVAMLSLAGIPLTAGFIAKFYVIVLSYDAQLWWLLGTLVVGSAIGIYYYLRVIFSMASAAQGASPVRRESTRLAQSIGDFTHADGAWFRDLAASFHRSGESVLNGLRRAKIDNDSARRFT